MKIKLAAFDWNGTIISDVNAVVKAESAVLKHYGRPPTNLRQFRAVFTIPIRDYWVAMGMDGKMFDEKSGEIHKIFNSYYEPLEKRCRTRRGAQSLLKWLAKNNIRAVIYSNHEKPHIEKQLKRLKIDSLIDTVLGSELDNAVHMQKRQKHFKLGEYVGGMKVWPSEVVIIGDSEEDVKIGQDYGYNTVGLTGGWQSTRRLKASKPDYLIANLPALKQIIEKI